MKSKIIRKYKVGKRIITYRINVADKGIPFVLRAKDLGENIFIKFPNVHSKV
jgi:hypothetical protein